MTLASSDIEADLFYVADDGVSVFKRAVHEINETTGQPTGKVQMGFKVCVCDEFVEGAAEQIARALNRLPKAEAILIDVASTIRSETANWDRGDDFPQAILDRADAVEEWMVS